MRFSLLILAFPIMLSPGQSQSLVETDSSNGAAVANWYSLDTYQLDEQHESRMLVRFYERIASFKPLDSTQSYAALPQYLTYVVDNTGAIGKTAHMLPPSNIVYLSSTDRALSTAYQVSSGYMSEIKVSVSILCTLTLTTGQSGSVALQVSPNGTTGWVTAASVPSSNAGTLSIGVNTTQGGGGELSAILMPGYYWKLVTSGTGTFAFTGGQQVIY